MAITKVNSDGEPGVNYARLKNRRDFSWTIDNMVTFDRTFAEKHKVGVTLLQTASAWNIEESSMAANKIAKPSYLWNAFGTIDLTNTDHKASMGSGITERQLTSYMVRLNYGFNERYLLTVSGRWDGASQLADGTATLKDSSGTLADGVTQLNEGAITLKDGMAQFNSEAIEPITKLVDSDAQTAVDTIKAVVKAGQEYNSFLDKSDDKAGSVTFVYKTAGITANK